MTKPQVASDVDTRLVVAPGVPQLGDRNDTLVCRTGGIDQLARRTVMADGAYRGNPEVIIPYREPAEGTELPQWKQHVKEWKILRGYPPRRVPYMSSFSCCVMAAENSCGLPTISI